MRFAEVFGYAPAGVWAAPGRINLIGEHTDYTGGFVLPLALPQTVRCAAAARPDRQLRLRSAQVPDTPVDVARLEPSAVDGWAAYPAGVVWALRSFGLPVEGLDLLLDGDLPLGAGLSSSAAVTCSVALACNDLFGLGLEPTRLAQIAQCAENDFAGAPVGIMDQMAAMHGRAGHVLFLDTRSLGFAPGGLRLPDLARLVIDPGGRRDNVGGSYRDRRRSCEAAESALGRSLRDVTALDVVALPDDVVRRRARHVVTENDRVRSVVALLRAGRDPRRIGPALTASHTSLRDDFEASCRELDCAVGAALSAGAHGARLTGGGFGGSAIALVDAEAAETVTVAVRAAFAANGYPAPTTFTVTPAGGARRIS